MKEQILSMKQDLKEITRQIKEKKSQRRNKEITGGTGLVPGLLELKNVFRHKHVAYCLARGKKLEQIDSANPKTGYNQEWVDWILRTMNPESKEKLYVVVNEKLHPSQQAVQAGHALAEFLRKNPNTQWRNGHLIYLKDAPNGAGDMRSYYQLKYGMSQYAEFAEPDLGDKITAYACFSPDAERLLKDRKLV